MLIASPAGVTVTVRSPLVVELRSSGGTGPAARDRRERPRRRALDDAVIARALVIVLGLSMSACVTTARGGVGYSGGPTGGHFEGSAVLGEGFGDAEDGVVVDVGVHGGDQNLVVTGGIEYRHQPSVDAEGMHRVGVRVGAAGGYAGAGRGLASAGGAAEADLGLLVLALDRDTSRLFVSLGGTAGYRFASTLAGPYGGLALGFEWYAVVLRGVPGLR